MSWKFAIEVIGLMYEIE